MNETRTKREIPILVLVTVGVVLLGFFLLERDEVGTSSEEEELWGYRFSIVDRTGSLTFLLHENDEERIEVLRTEGIEEETATALISDKVNAFGSLFEPRRVGYAGQHTSQIQCPDEYKPTYTEQTLGDGSLRYFSTFSNDRFAAGVCSEQDAAYRLKVIYLQCSERRTVYEIRHFTSVSPSIASTDFIQALSC